MDEPVVAELVALADERRVPVLIHAGRGIPALGELTVRLAERYPDATLILAHAAISDLAWLWRVLPEHPNVLIDTAWWNPVDLVALFALAPPANIVWASDSPYGRPLASAVMALRCALQAGLTPEQLRGIAGGDDGAGARRARARRPRAAARPAPQALDLLLERCHSATSRRRSRGSWAAADWEEPIVLARLCLRRRARTARDADVFAAVLGGARPLRGGARARRAGPAVPVRAAPPRARARRSRARPTCRCPALPDAPPPTRAAAES